MSINLPAQSLSSVIVGSTGSIELKPVNRTGTIPQGKFPTVVFLNESGVGLSVNFQGSNREMVLPAGVWSKPIPVYNTDNSIDWKVLYILPNSPVAVLYTIFYDATETPLEIAALGNSPIGISGNVATSNSQSLINDGNPAPTQIIESTPSGQGSSSFALNNDGSGFWQILSANTLRQIINAVRGNTGTGKAVISIGDAGDLTITTFFGTLGAGVIIAGANVVGNVAGANTLANGANVPGGTLGIAANGDLLDATGNAPNLFIKSGTGGATFIQSGNGTTVFGVDTNGVLRIGGSSSVNNPTIKPDTTNSQLALVSKQSGITAQGIGFTCWSGSAAVIPFSVGGQFNSALSWIDTSGNFQQNGNQVVQFKSAGGGAAGITNWVGTTDPGVAAGEGDTWDKA